MTDTPNSPGWYPVGGDPHDLTYWDGRHWVARARFFEGRWHQETLPTAPSDHLLAGQPESSWSQVGIEQANPLGASSDGLELEVAEPAAQRRLTVLFRLVLVVPHVFVLFLLGVVVTVVAVAMWFVALFTRRVPPSLRGFVWAYVQWNARVSAYLYLLTDRYPPFVFGPAPYPVQLSLSAPEECNRSEVFFRYVLAYPVLLLMGLAAYGGLMVGLVAWFATLIRGQLPRSFHVAFTSIVRFQARSAAYLYLLTGRYPKLPFADTDGVGPNATPLTYGARSALAWSFGSGFLWIIVLVAVGIPTFFGFRSVPQLSAVQQIQFTTAVNTYAQVVEQANADAAHCPAPPAQATCLSSVLQSWSRGANALAGSIESISFPNDSVLDARQLSTDARQLVADLNQAATLGNSAAIIQRLDSQINPVSNRLGQDINELDVALGSPA